MINYAGEKITFEGCPGCAYSNHEFSLPCGIAYENEVLTLSQDWELPIPGFMIVSSKRHAEKLSELTKEEQIEIFSVVDRTIKVLRENNVCDRFNVIFEEKEDRHFHIWVMPRYKWMKDLVGDITDNLGKVLEYAINNMRTKENIKRIKEINDIVMNSFK